MPCASILLVTRDAGLGGVLAVSVDVTAQGGAELVGCAVLALDALLDEGLLDFVGLQCGTHRSVEPRHDVSRHALLWVIRVCPLHVCFTANTGHVAALQRSIQREV